MHQYRITVNGESRIRDAYPADWPYIAEQSEERGIVATMEQRCIFNDDSIMPLLTDPRGYMRLPGGRVVSPWQTIAQIN